MPSKITSFAVSQILLLLSALPAIAQTTPKEAPSTPEAAFRVGNGVTAPRVTYQPDPEYSEQARKAGRQGTCVLEFVVGVDGKTRDIKVVQPVGMGLDEKSVEALRAWKFEPGLKEGKPVAVQMKVEVSFSLDGGNDPKFKEWLEQLRTMPNPYPPVVTKVEPCSLKSSAHDQNPERLEIVVADLNFEGTPQLPPSELDEIARSIKQVAYAGNLEHVTDQFTEKLRADWRDRGYFKASIAIDPRVLTSNPVSERIALTVHIDAGRQYRLGGISFKNNKVLTNTKVLRELFPIANGDILARDKIGKGMADLRRAYLEFGFYDFTSDPDIRFDEEKNLAYLDINIDEGKQFHIKAVTLAGLRRKHAAGHCDGHPIQAW